MYYISRTSSNVQCIKQHVHLEFTFTRLMLDPSSLMLDIPTRRTHMIAHVMICCLLKKGSRTIGISVGHSVLSDKQDVSQESIVYYYHSDVSTTRDFLVFRRLFRTNFSLRTRRFISMFYNSVYVFLLLRFG